MVFSWLQIILLVLSFLIIILVMLQESKSDGASGALMGGGLNLFSKTKDRGFAAIISTLTMYILMAYIVVAIILKMQ